VIPSRMLAYLATNDVHIHSIFTSTITEHDIDAQLMTSQGGSPPLDILVRISGVNRLSDSPLAGTFLLRDSSTCMISHFSTSVLRKYTVTFLVNILAGVRLVGFCSHHPRLPEESLVTKTDAILFVIIHSFMGFHLLFHSLKELPHHRVRRSAMTI
jgi:hypothetical protein